MVSNGIKKIKEIGSFINWKLINQLINIENVADSFARNKSRRELLAAPMV